MKNKEICYFEEYRVGFNYCKLLKVAIVTKELKTMYHTDKGKIFKKDVPNIAPYSDEFYIKQKELKRVYEEARLFGHLDYLLRISNCDEVNRAKNLNDIVSIAENKILRLQKLINKAKELK